MWIVLLLVLLLLVYFVGFSPSSQLFGPVTSGLNTKDKLVALTFDDGPNDPYTSQILDILSEFKVPGNFFLVGQNCLRQPETVKKIFLQGHLVGNHSFSHSFLQPMIAPNFEQEIKKTQDILFSLTGKRPAFFRPPWFFRQPAMLATAQKLHLTTVTGTFASFFEVFQVSAAKIAKDAIKNTSPGTILVVHDGYNNKTASRTQTVAALKILIPELQKVGYTFVTLSQMLGIPASQHS